MALFGSYAPPGVYTSVVISGAGIPLFGNVRIPVVIGEGQEFFEQDNVELHRGSSSVADEQVVNENISDQATDITNHLHCTYFPVVIGDGTGTVTDDPSKVQVVVDGIPATVIQLDGTTGDFYTQELITPGQNVEITYYFKRTDTLISNEDESDQVPSFAAWQAYDTNQNYLPISVQLPGVTGSNVTVIVTDDTLDSPPGTGVLDTQAIGGAGTDTITLDIAKVGGGKRTLHDFYNLIQAGIPTNDAGYLTAQPPVLAGSPPVLSAMYPATYRLQGGYGPNTNKVFKVQHVPIVDGSNGGVVTTDPTKVKALVNGSKATVSAVDGQHGLVTLANGVVAGSTLTLTYYTNTYQNTYDLLPASSVSSIVEVGLGPNRADFIEDTDYVLGRTPAATTPSTGVPAPPPPWGSPLPATPPSAPSRLRLPWWTRGYGCGPPSGVPATARTWSSPCRTALPTMARLRTTRPR